jgi:hypothetical protein
MSDSSMDDRELRERVEKRLRARQEFNIHLTVYIIVNLFLWFLWFLIPRMMIVAGMGGEALTAASVPWPLIVMGGWGIGLVIHGLDVYSKTRAATMRHEARVQQEMELERQRIAEIRGEMLEKPKRRARLAEDGEIVYEDEEEQIDDVPVRRARRRE